MRHTTSSRTEARYVYAASDPSYDPNQRGWSSWLAGVGETEKAVAEIDVGGSGGGAEGGGEAVKAAEAGLGDTRPADDGHVLGSVVLADADAAGDEADGERLAFAKLADHGPAAGISEYAADSGKGDGWGGFIFHGFAMSEAEVAFRVEEEARFDAEIAVGEADVTFGRENIVFGEAEGVIGYQENTFGIGEIAFWCAEVAFCLADHGFREAEVAFG